MENMPTGRDAVLAWMLGLTDYLSAFNGLAKPFVDAFEVQASPLAVT